MKEILKEIQDGKFSNTWIEENENGMPKFKKLMQEDLDHPIEKVGADLRGRMDWLED
jgi:ketol-acid reductoisomerase